ncbi:hypothetical protein MED134_02870 [Dokdonia sp. MED134]|uniref:DUF6252 family protein n=1 Tax=Dokdonia sp. MED134 TaxID=313590 RepID=UPI0001F81579|nr:DUF6252 family protein [Dokdonia sp. MED134]EAQ38903.2 hypothetical protein MED134_02870 [Dokdonia sp. MED134]
MMKKLYFIYLLLILASVTTTSCEDEQLEGEFAADPVSVATGSFTASVNGEGFSSQAIASTEGTIGTTTIEAFSIIAANSTGQGISIILNTYDGVGTYALDLEAGNIGNSGAYSDVGDLNDPVLTTYITSLSGGTGSITITEIDLDNLVTSGTFSFTAVNNNGEGDTATITNGVFSNIPIINN